MELSKHLSVCSIGSEPGDLLNWGWRNSRLSVLHSKQFHSHAWLSKVQRKGYKALCERIDDGPLQYPGPNPWNLCMLLSVAKGFADVIKLRIMKWGDYPGLPGCALYVIHKCPQKKEAADRGRFYYWEGNVAASAKKDFKMLRCWLWRWKRAPQSQRMQGRQLQKLRNGTDWIFHSADPL